MPKPFIHRNGRWCIHYSPKLSPTGKDAFVYFDDEDAAKQDLKERVGERIEHGKSFVTAAERQWVHYLRQQLGDDLKLLPQVLEHWRATGAGSIKPTSIKEAVEAFKAQHLPEVKHRTASDIRSRLSRFASDLDGREVHSVHASDIERWLHSFSNRNTRRSYWKRIAPFFAWAVRNRMVAENPLDMLKAPETKRARVKVYTPADFKRMLEWTEKETERLQVRAFLALAGLCFLRTAEIVRLYAGEEVIRWSDILWRRKLVHVRGEVAKETRRASDDRFPPIDTAFEKVMIRFMDLKEGRCVELMHHDFSKLWRKMHADLELTAIPNGLRKSCISYTLAARPELGIVQCAKWAGNSEGTIRKHYLEQLSQEDAEKWFHVDAMF
jgi:site-specific recombinase XerD